MTKQNDLNKCYKVLGLKPGASLSEVKQAYRKLVKTEHPDLFNHDPLRRRQAEEKFRQISEAYVKLRNFYQPSSTDTSFNPNRNSDVTSARNTRSANTSTPNSTHTSSASRTSTQNASDTSNNRDSRRPGWILPVAASVSLVSAIAIVWANISGNNFNYQSNLPPKNPATPSPDFSPQPLPQPQPSPQVAAATAQPPQCRAIAPTIGNSARVFTQPSRNADTGKRIPQNTKVSFVRGLREFVEIQLPDKSKGWIFNDQLYPCAVEADTRPKIVSISTSPQRCVVIAPTVAIGTRIFSQPSRNADLGKRIPKNVRATLLGERREFVEIKLADGTQGWVFNDQIQAQPCSPSNSAIQTASNPERSPQCRIVSPTIGDSARIFTQAARNSYRGKRIPQGTKVAFIGGLNEFVEIQLPDKSKGWMFNDQIQPCTIKFTSQAQITSILKQPQQCLTIVPRAGGGAGFFRQASRNTYTGKRLPKQTQVSYLRDQKEFVEIKLADGTQGWLFNDQVQPCQ